MPLIGQTDKAAQQYCLRWKYHQSNLQVMFAQLLERESLCDVTLACEGGTLKAHKIMLSACSTYFDDIFSEHKEKDSIVILKDAKFEDIKALIEFMYKGEIYVDNSQFNTLLETAEELRIKGLAAVSWRSNEGSWHSVETQNSSQHNKVSDEHPQLSRKRKIETKVNDIHGPKVSCNAGTSTDEFPSESDEDSQDGTMWDTRSHEDIYSESEYFTPQLSNNNPSSPVEEYLCTPDASPTPSTPNKTSNNILNGVKPELMNVIKMNAYIQQGGKRPHFWETSKTKSVMEAIKNKEIEMKVAAQLLGVSYGTLYGRYREAYGCLKQPYRSRDFWQVPSAVKVLSRLQRNELSLFKAAEMLNVTVTTLANHLATMNEIEIEDEEGSGDSVACPQQTPNKNRDLTIIKEGDAAKSVDRNNYQRTSSKTPDITIANEENQDYSNSFNGNNAQQTPSKNHNITIVEEEKQDDDVNSVNRNNALQTPSKKPDIFKEKKSR